MSRRSKVSMALGRLDGPVYFESSDGRIVLPPNESDARYFYEYYRDSRGKTYKDYGFEFRKAETLAEVDGLQKRLVEQERREAERSAFRDERSMEEKWKQIGDSLRQRMVSSSTSENEKEFIGLYLQLREDKRAKHRQRWLERTSYLWQREQDSSTLPTDRMKG